jgi:hypothetical protein
MAASTNLAEAFNKTLANREPSTRGTPETLASGPLQRLRADFQSAEYESLIPIKS